MDLLRLAVRRSFSQLMLTAALVGTTAATVGVLAAGFVFAGGVERAVVFGYMQRSSPLVKDTFVNLLTRSSGFDPVTATRRLRSSVSPLRPSRIVFQEESGIAIVRAGRESEKAPLAFREGLIREVPVVEGRDPRGEDQVLVPTSLGLAPGTRVVLDYYRHTTATVAGVYWPGGVKDKLVTGKDRLMAVGNAATGTLPILATRTAFAALVRAMAPRSTMAVEWDVEPSFSDLTVNGLQKLANREPRVRAAVTAALPGSNVSSRLGRLLPGAKRAVTRGLAPTYTVGAAVALVGLGVLVGIALLKLERNSFELAVFRARGARTRELVALQAVDSALVALPALPLSLAIALAVATLARSARGPALPGAVFPLTLTPLAIVVAAAGCGLALVGLVLLSLPLLRRTIVQERRESSRQSSPAWLRLPYEVVPLVAGGLAYFELRRHALASSTGGTDALALLTPTLLLLGAAPLALRLLLALARRGERAGNRLRSPVLYLALRRASRSRATASLGLLLILSAGLFGFASSIRATQLSRDRQAARQRVGADWAVTVDEPRQPLVAETALGHDVTLAFLGVASSWSSGRLALADVVGIDPSTYGRGAWWQSRDAAVPLGSLLARMGSPPLGLRLPPKASAMQLTVTCGAGDDGLRLTAVTTSRSGAVRDRALGALRPGTHTYRTGVPGGGRLLSVLVEQPAKAPTGSPGSAVPIGFERLALSGDGTSRLVDLSSWTGLDTGRGFVPTTASDGALEAKVKPAGGGPVGGIAPPRPPLPALLAGVGASPLPHPSVRIGLTGATVRLPLSAMGRVRSFPLGSLPDFPTVVVPIRSLVERFEQEGRSATGGSFAVLAMGPRNPTSLARTAGFRVVRLSSAADVEAELATRQEALAVGMDFAASVTSVLLALLALALGVYFGARRRDYEYASLEAVGSTRRHAILSLAAEYGGLLAVSLAFGYGLGIGLLGLVLPFVTPPTLAPAASGSVTDWTTILSASVAVTAVFGAALGLAGLRLRRLSSMGLLRGEPQ